MTARKQPLPRPVEDQGKRLATLPRDFGYELRVTLKKYQGNPYVDIRQWCHDGGGGYRPIPRKGTSVYRHELAFVVDALRQALQEIGPQGSPESTG